MPRRLSTEDLLNPQRVFYRLFKEYSEGSLGFRQHYFRARVEAVDTEGGQLEASPPNPPNSIRARVYTNGLDATTPSAALSIFYPMLPGNVSTPPAPGEHVYVIFEDENMSSGLWLAAIASYSNLNYSNPDFRSSTTTDSSYAFEGDEPPSTYVNPDLEYGGSTANTEGREEMVSLVESSSERNFWTGKKVLLFGDSQVAGVFGTALGRKLTSEAGAARFNKVGRVGWGVNSWLNQRLRSSDERLDSIPTIIERYDPDVVIVSLGGNDGANGQARRADYEDRVRRLWDMVVSRSEHHIWSGPPTAVGRGAEHQPGRVSAANKIISVVGTDLFINCFGVTNVTDGRSPDGIHFGASSSALGPWTDLIVQKGNTFT